MLHDPARGLTAGAFLDFFFFGGAAGTCVYPAFGPLCTGLSEPVLVLPAGDELACPLAFGLCFLAFFFLLAGFEGSAKPALSN